MPADPSLTNHDCVSRPPGSARPVQLLVICSATLAFAASLLASTFYQHDPHWMFDLAVYRKAALAVLHGQPVYLLAPHPLFTYPPFAALLLTPLALLPLDDDAILWSAASLLALECTVWLTIGRLRSTDNRKRVLLTIAVTAVAIWLDPVASNLLLGQVNIFLMLLVLVDLKAADGRRWKGAGVGLAAAIKLTPAFFVLYLLATRRLRAAAAATATFLIATVAGFIVLPSESARYWSGLYLDVGRVGSVQSVYSQSIRSVLTRWDHGMHSLRLEWLGLSALVVLFGLALAVEAHRRGLELLAVQVVALVILLVSPITWEHHWVWVVPILVLLAQSAWDMRSWPLSALLVLITVEFLLRPPQWGIRQGDASAALHLTFVQLVQTSTYLLTGVVLMAACLAVTIRRRWPPSGRSREESEPDREGDRGPPLE